MTERSHGLDPRGPLRSGFFDQLDLAPQQIEAAFRLISRDWSPYLTSNEFRILSYAFDNSLQRGRAALRATYTEMATGIPSANGSETWSLPPLAISRSKFYALLGSLKDKGALTVKAEHGCTCIEINLDWSPEAGVPSMGDEIARTASRAGHGRTSH